VSGSEPAANPGLVRDWARERVLVTGGGGFLGRHLVDALRARRPAALLAPKHAELDLMERAAVRAFFASEKPTVVLHVAGAIGGIAANVAHPGEFVYRNVVMGAELLEACRLASVRRVVVAGTTCEYPADAPLPVAPASLWNGAPAPETAPYGHAKRLLFVQGEAYAKEHGLSVSHAILANLYGPGDHLDEARSHVATALLRRCLEARAARAKEIVAWGSGTPTREFIFVRDAAEGLLLAAERDPGGAPLNLGSGEEVAIADLARLAAEAAGFQGAVRFYPSKPDGAKRRVLDSSAARALGFAPRTRLAEGLRETADWMARELGIARG
jgi:GDP-L-fucose synthase